MSFLRCRLITNALAGKDLHCIGTLDIPHPPAMCALPYMVCVLRMYVVVVVVIIHVHVHVLLSLLLMADLSVLCALSYSSLFSKSTQTVLQENSHIMHMVLHYIWIQTPDTFIQLENQRFYTSVNVSVSPHTLWLRSDPSQTLTSTFTSPPARKIEDYTVFTNAGFPICVCILCMYITYMYIH